MVFCTFSTLYYPKIFSKGMVEGNRSQNFPFHAQSSFLNILAFFLLLDSSYNLQFLSTCLLFMLLFPEMPPDISMCSTILNETGTQQGSIISVDETMNPEESQFKGRGIVESECDGLVVFSFHSLSLQDSSGRIQQLRSGVRQYLSPFCLGFPLKCNQNGDRWMSCDPVPEAMTGMVTVGSVGPAQPHGQGSMSGIVSFLSPQCTWEQWVLQSGVTLYLQVTGHFWIKCY